VQNFWYTDDATMSPTKARGISTHADASKGGVRHIEVVQGQQSTEERSLAPRCATKWAGG